VRQKPGPIDPEIAKPAVTLIIRLDLTIRALVNGGYGELKAAFIHLVSVLTPYRVRGTIPSSQYVMREDDD
jgi:hypothetical protein